ncbi:GumC family protein [Azospirillum sp.]|uniref:GumC family protein n=1 Tax=Azospirillum sp. TaxID=34012 RepID=UPI003D71ECF9
MRIHPDADLLPVDARGHFASADGWSHRGLATAPGTPPGMGTALRRVGGFLRRRKLLILSVALPAFLALGALAAMMPPRYVAEAKVQIDPRTPKILKPDPILPPMAMESETVQTATHLLTSVDLVHRAIEDLNLRDDPDLAFPARAPLRERALMATRTFLPDAVQGYLDQVFQRGGGGMGEDALITRRFLSNLRVSQEGRAHVLSVRYAASSPERAAQVVNGYVRLFVAIQAEQKAQEAANAYEWLSRRVEEARRKVQIADARIEEFRRANDLIKGRENTPAAQEVSEVASELTAARSARDQAVAKLRRGQELLAQNQIDALGEMQRSPVIQQLRIVEAAALRQVADLGQTYGDQHPQLTRARADLAKIREKIRGEGVQLVNSLKSDADVAVAHVEALTRTAQAARDRVALQNDANIELRALEREATADRESAESLLSRLKEVAEERLLRPSAEAKLISSADPPEGPVSPNLRLLLPAALGIALFFGTTMAAVAEQVRRGIRSILEVEPELGVPALALVPHSRKAVDLPVKKPHAAFVEGLRHLYAGLSPDGSPPTPGTVILVASSVAEEGKTTIALGLGRLLSQADRDVVLLDLDLRRSTLDRLFGRDRPGVGEVLRGEMGIDDVIVRDPVSGMAVIPAGHAGKDPSFLLGSPAMSQLIDDLRARFATVIMDSSPVIPVSDTMMIARHADHTVMVMRWEKTAPETTRLALQRLVGAGASVTGIVVSRVSLKRHATYAFGDSCLSDRKNSRYYRHA